MYSDKGGKKTIFKSPFKNTMFQKKKNTMFHLYLEETQEKKLFIIPRLVRITISRKKSIT